MGTDITGVVERRVDERWICVNTLSRVRKGPDWDDEYGPRCLSRNYRRFAALAGVRSGGEGEPAPRGLPPDISETGRFLAESHRSGHTHSWLPLTEAARIMLETESEQKAQSAARGDPCDYYFDEREDDAAECRFVFWFDS